jgi:hypothetical protein
MRTYQFKLIGKPLHPNKQNVLFQMFNDWLNTPGAERLENEDWRILGEQCAIITVQNKHTFEIFEFSILGI